ncbi:MAG: hypothetical protein WCB92_34375 [Mycobacterium sp.]
MPVESDFPWVGTYTAVPPSASPGTDRRTYQLELHGDQTFRLIEEGDLTVGGVQGRWILSSSTSASAAPQVDGSTESFDFITLVPEDGELLLQFGIILFPITLRVGEFGIRDPSTIATRAGWLRR